MESLSTVGVGEIPYGYDSGYTLSQCFELEDQYNQVLCESQRLNVTDPPSIYGFQNFSNVWSGVGCLLLNVTLRDRQGFEQTMHNCTVPMRGYDAFLFVALALLATCFLFGKLSTVFVLITGATLGLINYYANLLELGNAVAIWLNINPPELFLYAFLPPLIVEQAIRIDFYLFKKQFFHSIMLAVVMVILTAIILTPIILFVLRFNSDGWNWVHGALFSSIVAPTDALAVSSILKKSRGPVKLTSIMEGESLLNDATGITLFIVFLSVLDDNIGKPVPSVWSVIPTILLDIVRLSSIGFGIGLGFSLISYYILKWLRWKGASSYVEATYVLAMAYLVYYVTNGPADGSGVIAVVTFGLFGNATFLWGMTGSAFKSGDFDAMWDMVSFAANGLVFFWAGLASMNFIIRSITMIPKSALTYVSIFLIYIFMMMIRTFCVALFNPLFYLVDQPLSVAEIAFVGWSGLRGAVSLILVTSLSFTSVFDIAYNSLDDIKTASSYANVRSDIALWTSCFVILTLIINGPLIGPLLKSFGLNKTSKAAHRIQRKAKIALLEFTENKIKEYEDDDDAFLTGADWEAVAKYVDISDTKFGRDDAGKNGKESKERYEVNSYWWVFKAMVTTLGKKIKSDALYWFNLVARPFKRDNHDKKHHSMSRNNSYADIEANSSEKSDSEETEEDFVNECHYQKIDRTESQRAIGTDVDVIGSPIIISPATNKPSLDEEVGVSVSGDSESQMSTEQYSNECLTAAAGQKLFQELQKTLSKNIPLEELEGMENFQEKNYSSMPAASGKELLETFQARLQRTRTTMVNFDTDVDSVAATEQPGSIREPPKLSDMKSSFPSSKDSYDEQVPEVSSPSWPGRPAPALDRSHATISATTGKYLQHELMKKKNYPYRSADRRLDLLGQKSPASHAVDDSDVFNGVHLGRVSHISRDLANRSNFTQLKQEIEDVDVSLPSIHETRTLSSLSATKDPEQATDENLEEIRFRLIGGLKRRFKERRSEGKISIEAFQILEQSCLQEMESPSRKLQLWDGMVKKTQGTFTSTIATLSFKCTKYFKKRPTWEKRILYYPYSMVSRIFRQYLGRKLLVSCEVAIEYTLALSSSQHVKWLKMHDEYFCTLLDEVEQEAQKSHSFITDREIEAPDTFRAIQSYRAAVLVLKSMQKFVEDLTVAGVLDEGEKDKLQGYVDEKLRKLELTGPVWRPAKLTDLMRTLRPFNTLDHMTYRWIWDRGLVQEFKPGEVIYMNSVETTAQGMFHVKWSGPNVRIQ